MKFPYEDRLSEMIVLLAQTTRNTNQRLRKQGRRRRSMREEIYSWCFSCVEMNVTPEARLYLRVNLTLTFLGLLDLHFCDRQLSLQLRR